MKFLIKNILKEATLKKSFKQNLNNILKKYGYLGKSISRISHGVTFEIPYSNELIQDLESIGWTVFPDMIQTVTNKEHPDYGQKYIELNVYVGPDSTDKGLREAKLKKKFKVEPKYIKIGDKVQYKGGLQNENTDLFYSIKESEFTQGNYYTITSISTVGDKFVFLIRNNYGVERLLNCRLVKKYFNYVKNQSETELSEAKLNKPFRGDLELKVGDKLRFIKDTSRGFTKGNIYRIVNREKSEVLPTIFKVETDDGGTNSFTPLGIFNFFEKVETETELNEMEPIQPTEVPKWESGLNRGKANPIGNQTKWESGLTRGHANSLF